MALIQAQIIRNPAAVVIPVAVVLDRQIAVEHLLDKIVPLQGLYQLAHLMVLHLQQVKVVQRPHRHSIHSSGSLQKLMQVTDPQAPDQIMAPLPQQAPDQIMGPLPQQAPDQIMGPVPQRVTQVLSDEASLTSQPHPLVVHRDPQQIMLMEVPLKHRRYSVVSLPRPHHRLMVRRVEMIPPQVRQHQLAHLKALPQ